ncbi:MAG TPA: hypothetical protein VKZ71_00640, partial [Burkholderiaceae bacterium]|nr:hypothetical protein [Burkholderiaceae bacterium]
MLCSDFRRFLQWVWLVVALAGSSAWAHLPAGDGARSALAVAALTPSAATAGIGTPALSDVP